MKRFLVFCGVTYYPGGGWNDFEDSFDTLEEAITAGKTDNNDWFQVIDSNTFELVADMSKSLSTGEWL